MCGLVRRRRGYWLSLALARRVGRYQLCLRSDQGSRDGAFTVAKCVNHVCTIWIWPVALQSLSSDNLAKDHAMFARMDTTSHKHGAVRSARLSPECRTVLSGDLSFSAPVIHRNSSCACGGGCPSCRAKSNELNVSQPDDPAESEADQIADRIMRMSVDEVLSDSNLPHSVARLYRTSDVEEEGAAFSDNIQCQVAVTPTTPTVSSDGTPPLIQNVMNSGGQPLDRQTRSFFEPRFGCDLSSVRIHADGTAGESARTISARAYALDNHIVFGDGEYRPETSAGKLL